MRRAYIDWARGLAVLLMIEAHTTDAWTSPASKSTIAFRNATILGGFAAPLFLWLAGVALVLSAERRLQRTGDRTAAAEAICRRGLEIFLLAFLFRLQALILSPGGPLIALFRVDILNIMGPAIAIAGLLWAAAPTPVVRALVFSIGAAVIAMTTPIVRAASSVDRLPAWLQWYLRPAGEHTTFTAFPWIGFVLAGAAVGVLIAAARDHTSGRRMHVALAIAGGALIAFGFVAALRPSIYSVSSFWTSSPTWFAIRVGVLMVALCALYAVENTKIRFAFSRFRVFASGLDAVALLGRSSLFVYWIHVELVYGYASWLWRGRLPLWGTAIAYTAFSTLMYFAIILRDRLAARGVESRTPVRSVVTRTEEAS